MKQAGAQRIAILGAFVILSIYSIIIYTNVILDCEAWTGLEILTFQKVAQTQRHNALSCNGVQGWSPPPPVAY